MIPRVLLGALALLPWTALADPPAPAKAGEPSGSAPALAKPRFALQDIDWPKKPGEASICLWANDKLAALSVTVSGNAAPDVDWWLAQSAKYGKFPITWFLVTGQVGEKKASYRGTWELYKKLLDQGQGIESNTVTGLSSDLPGWQGVEWEYAESQRQIEAGLPGHKARFLAYPGGPNGKLNDHQLAAKYYLAARAPTGGINYANQIDYLNVHSIEAGVSEQPVRAFADMAYMLDPGSRSFRGWTVWSSQKVQKKEAFQPLFDFIAANQDQLWLGLFGDVAMYGQERDTAKLTVDKNGPDEIALTVADLMDGARFDYPLTVKVRLPDGWQGVRARQNGRETAAKAVEHDKARFALVSVAPGRGQVVLSEP